VRDPSASRRSAARRAIPRARPVLAWRLALVAAAAPALAAVAPGAGGAAAKGSGSVELKVLTYNVEGLPLLTDFDRFKWIGRVLAERRRLGDEPDVVLLQEAWVKKARRIRDRAGYAYAIRGVTGQKGIFYNSSGLEILSDYPIVARYGRTFNSCSFPECFVSKSILGVTLQIPGVPYPVQVFTTHLQAHTIHDAIRMRQLRDIDTFFHRIGFGRDVAIFAGDFNFKPKHQSYHQFLEDFPVEDAGYFCLQDPRDCTIVVGTHGRTDLTDVWKTTDDRHFFYQPEGSALRIEPVRLIRNFTQKVDGERLSDHWGYEVHYRLSW
jgi:endonuclease/exonuclease/phosphatase family metal-dependent hydrolase